MALVACTVMLKDEASFVEPFVRYHAALFGIRNVFVFDNGSTDPVVVAALAAFEREGLNVDRDHRTQADFRDKGDVVGEFVRKLDQEAKYDFYVLLDCDEFVTLRWGAGFTCEPRTVHSYLDRFRGEARMLKVEANLQNILGSPGEFQEAPYSKVIFPHGVLAWTDHGFHMGRSRSGADYLPCDIVYAHFHYRPYEDVVRFARQKLSAEMPAADLDDPEKLRRFTGRGAHMVGYLTEGQDAYYGQFRGIARRVAFPELLERFRREGTAAPFADFILPQPEAAGSKPPPEVRPPHLVVDEATTGRIRGWAMEAANPDTPLRLRFLLDGRPVWEGTCDGIRRDVRESGHPAERVGYDFAPSVDATTGSVLTIEDGGGRRLRFMYGGHAVLEAPLEPASAPAEGDCAIYSHIDHFRHGRIQGWVLRGVAAPDGEKRLGGCKIALEREGIILVEVIADLDRPDVARGMAGDPRCGFVVAVPSLTGRRNSILRLFVMPERRELHGSPCVTAPVTMEAADG